MITFTALGDTHPKDIEVKTDDSQAELAELEDAFGDWSDQLQTFVNFEVMTEADEDGIWTFTIPGAEAGELDDVLGATPFSGEYAAMLDALAREASRG